MAGIGFELRKMVQEKNISSLAKAYGYSALLSSGPWVSSIIAILIIGFFSLTLNGEQTHDTSYQLIITYAFAFASSIMLTGFIQLPFTRYIADKIYEKREDLVLPSYIGALVLTMTLGFVILLPISFYVFAGESIKFIMLVVYIFIAMTGIWLANIIASSLKFYREIFFSYLFIYLMMIIVSYFYGDSVEKLLLIFLLGNLLLFCILSSFIIISYPSDKLISFDFFKMKNFYWFLAFSGFFYSLAVWVDKFVFWYHPLTGTQIFGKLQGSVVYDIPIFLAYLTIIPGMSISFFKLEAYFSQKYDRFFDAVKNGGTLKRIDRYRNEMISVIRSSMREVLYIQTIITVIIYLYTPEIFSLLNIPQLYTNLFHIDMIGAQLQLGFMSALSFLYYLDKRRATMWLSLLFLVLNFSLSLISIYLGPYFFGYGYAVSLLISFTVSLWVLNKTLEDLEYETFLLR
jgi:uncharacterized membrane protein